jgi:murein DD-endopeptidase MepM/ murein hydrolase activator NlpD
MPNNLSTIMAKILARGLMNLREQAVMPRLINGSYSAEAAQFGKTIDVPVPTARQAQDVTPSNVPPAPADNTPALVQIPLNKWKKSDFYLTDQDVLEIDRQKHFLPMTTQEAIRSLANQVNADILAEYKGVYGFAGTPGTTPFAASTQAATDARKVLHAQLAPRSDRRAVLNFDAEANALSLSAFQDVDKAGDTGVKREGEIGRKFGMDWFSDDQIPTHASTALSAGAATVNGAHAAGAGSTDGGRTGTVSINKATNPSNLVKGDILSFAGDSQTYTVLADVTLAVGNTSVQIAPALKSAKAGGEAVSLKASHVVNLAFHRDAFAFANRPLAASTQDLKLGNEILSMTDPQTGISLRLEVSRQYKQVVWEFDILYGVKLVRPELACRIAG